jgi:glyoxylase-like metal-dependent hydrolase (beta-lactamase superfamily II)
MTRYFIKGDERLPTASLCQFFDIEKPQYQVTDWASDGQSVVYEGRDLGLQIFQTPGHTPDELALWDREERVLFVGDTLYEWAHIVFSAEGDLVTYSDSLGKLRRLVEAWNTEPLQPRVKVACGHVTDGADGEELLREVDATFFQCAKGLLQSKEEGSFRDELVISFEREGWQDFFPRPQTIVRRIPSNFIRNGRSREKALLAGGRFLGIFSDLQLSRPSSKGKRPAIY